MKTEEWNSLSPYLSKTFEKLQLIDKMQLYFVKFDLKDFLSYLHWHKGFISPVGCLSTTSLWQPEKMIMFANIQVQARLTWYMKTPSETRQAP